VTCVCGKGESTETCCLPILKGTARAATPEALMRSRYAAYALGEIDWLLESTHPEHRGDVDLEATRAWSKNASWKGLEIVATEGGGDADETGVVEFKADFELGGMRQLHHERAEFKRKGDRWYFVDGQIVGQKPVTREGPRVGRNDPCTCGSGKKFKKCCGKAA